MKTYMMFLDECLSPITKIVSLTGMLVRVEDVVEIRNRFMVLMTPYTVGKDGVKGYSMPELHGSNFLRNSRIEIAESDKMCLLRDIIDLLKQFQVEIYRSGYYVNRTIRNCMCYRKRDKDIISACWDGIIRGIQGRLRTSYVIPIMDFCDDDQMRIMSQQLYSTHLLRHQSGQGGISIKHTEHIVGELYYAKSEFSICTQLVDVISYICHLQDLARYDMPLNSFQQTMLSNAAKVSALTMINSVLVMHSSEKALGPLKFQYAYFSSKVRRRKI